jgi:hypothetical protein
VASVVVGVKGAWQRVKRLAEDPDGLVPARNGRFILLRGLAKSLTRRSQSVDLA